MPLRAQYYGLRRYEPAQFGYSEPFTAGGRQDIGGRPALVPLGENRLNRVSTAGANLSEVGQFDPAGQSQLIFSQSSLGDKTMGLGGPGVGWIGPSVFENVPTMQNLPRAASWFDYQVGINLPPDYASAQQIQDIAQSAPLALPDPPKANSKSSEEGPMELGSDILNVLGGLAGQYINNRYGPQPVTYAAPGLLANQPIVATNADYGSAGPGVGVPYRDVINEPPACNPYKGMVWNPAANCGQGKWQRRSRRRKRALVTQSDINGLIKLKSAVGKGKIMEVWIAKNA